MNYKRFTLRFTPLYIVVLLSGFLTKAQDLTLVATASFTNAVENTKLDEAYAVAITSFTPTNGDADKTYALVVARADDSMQIIDITNPASPTHVVAIQDDGKDTDSTFTTLDSPQGITTVTIDSKHYALVASRSDNGLQIIEITDPENPVATAALVHEEEDSSSPQKTYKLQGARSVTTIVISQKTYALVIAGSSSNLEIIDISDPASPKIVSSIANAGTDANSNTYSLKFPKAVTTVTMDSQHYALVTASDIDNVQIIEITNPENPIAKASVKNSDAGYNLDEPYGITITTNDSKTYALVTTYTGSGLQIIDISDPDNPSAESFVRGGSYKLNGAYSVETTTIGSKVYALVSAYSGDSLQAIDISDPENPSATDSATDSTEITATDFNTLNGARSLAVAAIGENTYAVVTADSENDDGIQIIKLEESSFSRNEDFAGQRVALYPNPAQIELHLAYAQDTTVSYTVYDLTGRQLATHQARGTTHSLNISSLPTGNYLLEAKKGNQKGVFRFVKE